MDTVQNMKVSSVQRMCMAAKERQHPSFLRASFKFWMWEQEEAPCQVWKYLCFVIEKVIMKASSPSSSTFNESFFRMFWKPRNLSVVTTETSVGHTQAQKACILITKAQLSHGQGWDKTWTQDSLSSCYWRQLSDRMACLSGLNLELPLHVSMRTQSLQLGLTLCDSMDCSLPGSSCPWDSPGKNTGMGCHTLFQEIFPTQGLNSPLLCLALPADSWPTSCLGICNYFSHSTNAYF